MMDLPSHTWAVPGPGCRHQTCPAPLPRALRDGALAGEAPALLAMLSPPAQLSLLPDKRHQDLQGSNLLFNEAHTLIIIITDPNLSSTLHQC